MRRLLCAQRVVRPLTSSGFKLTAQTTSPNLTANRTSNSNSQVLPVTTMKSTLSSTMHTLNQIAATTKYDSNSTVTEYK